MYEYLPITKNWPRKYQLHLYPTLELHIIKTCPRKQTISLHKMSREPQTPPMLYARPATEEEEQRLIDSGMDSRVTRPGCPCCEGGVNLEYVNNKIRKYRLFPREDCVAEARTATAATIAEITGEGEPFAFRDAHQNFHHWVVVLNLQQLLHVALKNELEIIQESHVPYTLPDLVYYVVPRDGANLEAIDRTETLLKSFGSGVFGEDEGDDQTQLKFWRIILNNEQIRQVVAEEGVERVERFIPGLPDAYTTWHNENIPVRTHYRLNTIPRQMAAHHRATAYRRRGRFNELVGADAESQVTFAILEFDQMRRRIMENANSLPPLVPSSLPQRYDEGPGEIIELFLERLLEGAREEPFSWRPQPDLGPGEIVGPVNVDDIILEGIPPEGSSEVVTRNRRGRRLRGPLRLAESREAVEDDNGTPPF